MKKILIVFFTMIVSVLCVVSVFASTSSPVVFLENHASELIQKLDAKQNLSDNYVRSAIRQTVLPIFDVYIMSRSVIGRRYWNEASETEKEQFKTRFTRQVLSVYAAPLTEYDGDKIKFYPLRGEIPAHKRIVVHSKIIRKNGQQIPVDYRLIQKDGRWRVYDFSVEGISMVESYRSQYRETLQQGGVSALIRKMDGKRGRA